jgi:hypothetical protein
MDLGKCYDNKNDNMASKQLVNYIKQTSGKPRTSGSIHLEA